MRPEIERKLNDASATGYVHLANMHLTDAEIPELLIEMQRLIPTVSKIDLDNNDLTDDGAALLAEGLTTFAHLNELSVQNNRIDEAGIKALLRLKKHHSDLELFLHGNKVVDVFAVEDWIQGKSML